MTTLPEAERLRPLWVFGYGSLIWNPGFPIAERRIATAHGYRRAFCMLSIHHRGTVEDPGLVLALDHDAHALHPPCAGVAFRVAPGAEAETLAELRDRELISSAYREEIATLTLQDDTTLRALAYVIDRDHLQYVTLPLEEQARMIARAHGGRGPNTEYLFNTADHLVQLGIGDAELEWLAARVRALA
jgi:cation transport protein ChaC